MFTPKQFIQSDIEALHKLMTTNPLGSLVTMDQDGLTANHIPFELSKEPGPFGTLFGHVARANPVWKETSGEKEALVIFQGADSYISPSWYPSKQKHGKVVPTWNYVVVHAHGSIQTIGDREWLRSHVQRLSDREESHFEQPWSIDDAPADYIEKMLGAIVGIRIEISRLEGKWKVSQNRPAEDREGVTRVLLQQDSTQAREMAEFVEFVSSKEPDGN